MKPKAPTIHMSAVKSSQIESIGHQGVTAAQFTDLQKAESLGKAFGAFKVGRKFTKLDQ